MRSESWRVAMCGVLAWGVLLSAEPAERCERSTLPSNLTLSSDLGRTLQRLYDRSPTFRAQCERIAGAEHLFVNVRLNVAMPSHCRGFTKVRRRGLEIQADVHLPPGRDLVELVAHEFEHLLEQIEGLNLRALAHTRGSGVREVLADIYESDRAILAGRVVVGETYHHPQVPATD